MVSIALRLVDQPLLSEYSWLQWYFAFHLVKEGSDTVRFNVNEIPRKRDSPPMPRSLKLPYIPSSLRNLREIAGCTVEEAARRVQKDPDTIRHWESDEHDDLPTYAQASRLSDLYQYNTLLCLRELPPHIKPPEMPDFRTIDKNGAVSSEGFSRGLRLLLRDMETRQEFVTEFRSYWELPHQGWVGSESIQTTDTDPESLGGKMRSLLGVGIESQFGFSKVSDALAAWILAFNQEAGVFVCQTSNQGARGIELDEMRGLSLGDESAPFIAVNSKDADAARIFTLFHEFAHLWIGLPGISGYVGLEARAAQSPNGGVDSYCDAAAANALMPSGAFNDLWTDVAPRNTIQAVEQVANAFKVSRDAAAVRAANLERISWSQYADIRRELTQPRMPEKDNLGGGNFYRTHLRNVGRAYAGLVVATWLDRQIGIKEAGHYLGITPISVYPLARAMGLPV